MAGAADPVGAVGRRYIGGYCRRALRREVDLRVEGVEHVPHSGPVLIAARHVHHLFDGCALWTTIPRRVHLVVALDWVQAGRDRRLMDWATAALRWPAILRPDAPNGGDRDEVGRYARRGARDAVALLRAGGLLVVFPEGYPNVDQHPNPKTGLADRLPFQPGFVRFVALAQRDGQTRVAVVPTGFRYEREERGDRWRVTLRFDPPRSLAPGGDAAAFGRGVEERVAALSDPEPAETTAMKLKT